MWALLASLAYAELPPPDYAEELSRAAAEEVARVARSAGMDSATELATRWERQVRPSAQVRYELGLAWRLAGDEPKARAALDGAIDLDPDMVEAWYDRGEILLNRGDLDGAERDFQAVVRLQPGAWPGHFRLADVAGRRGDADTFERELIAALSGGWSARTVVGDQRWQAWISDPSLGPPLRRLLTVYQDERVIGEIERGAP